MKEHLSSDSLSDCLISLNLFCCFSENLLTIWPKMKAFYFQMQLGLSKEAVQLELIQIASLCV